MAFGVQGRSLTLLLHGTGSDDAAEAVRALSTPKGLQSRLLSEADSPWQWPSLGTALPAAVLLHLACQKWHSFWGQRGRRGQREKMFGSHCFPPTRSCPKHMAAVCCAVQLSLSLGCPTVAGLPLLCFKHQIRHQTPEAGGELALGCFPPNTQECTTLLDTDPGFHISQL